MKYLFSWTICIQFSHLLLKRQLHKCIEPHLFVPMRFENTNTMQDWATELKAGLTNNSKKLATEIRAGVINNRKKTDTVLRLFKKFAIRNC